MLKDILKTAGITYNKNTLGADLEKILTSNGKYNTLSDESSSSLLSSVSQKLAGEFGKSQTKLDEYLRSGGLETGIAIQQAQNRQEYTIAVQRFIEGGMLPDNYANSALIDRWQVLSVNRTTKRLLKRFAKKQAPIFWLRKNTDWTARQYASR